MINLNDHPGRSKHGNTTVLDLSLPRPIEIEPVREAKRVEADVANHGAVQILWPLRSRDCVDSETLENAILPELHFRTTGN